jgi:hypothetical protein
MGGGGQHAKAKDVKVMMNFKEAYTAISEYMER